MIFDCLAIVGVFFYLFVLFDFQFISRFVRLTCAKFSCGYEECSYLFRMFRMCFIYKCHLALQMYGFYFDDAKKCTRIYAKDTQLCNLLKLMGRHTVERKNTTRNAEKTKKPHRDCTFER